MRTVFSADWVLPVQGPPIENGAVAIEGSRIAAVGTAEELGEGTRYEEAVILPGFVDAHSHLEYAVYAGFGDGLSFGPWLELHMARKARLTRECSLDVARLGAAQCLATGITFVGDACFGGTSAAACDELGLRAVVYLEVFGSDPDAARARFEGLAEVAEEALSDRVRLGVSPHAPYSTGDDVYGFCLDLGLPVATHLNESPHELAWLLRGEGPFAALAHLLHEPTGESGIRRLGARGLLDERLLAAHCVKVDSEEIAVLAECDVAVAHCPRSNALLGCGIAPLTELRAAGVRVGLGTDSPASTPSFDMFEELRAAVFGARVRQESAAALPAAEALELATLGSARALRLESELGSLVGGKRADLTVVSLAGSSYLPWEDPAGAVVFGGSPDRVLLTVVDGEVRYEKGGFDWHELTAAAHSARRAMLGLPVAEPAATAPRA